VAKAKTKTKTGKTIRLTLLRSRFGQTPGHAQCAGGLGLRRRHQTIEVNDTPENRGMIDKIRYMLQIEEV
jgi:large subunit ribosomal protein L30